MRKKLCDSGLPFNRLSIKNEIFHKIKIKKITMKKLFIVLAVASLGFVACNNESKVEETTDTVTTPTVDTTAAPVTVDTTVKVDTAAKADTLKK
ncbi:MAG TPA: hypothetical protein VJ111_10295 [Chitinophagaceae bacterium]|nr:hypothetical protein [Chitinophagaceae bacterium]